MSIDEEIKILCVDDEKNVLKALERLFMDYEYKFITAMSAEEGLDILNKEERIQLIISDYRMPGMNGVDFLRTVYERWPESVRIVLSGYADTASIVGAINEGQIYKFIPKPWNDDELKLAIANALDFYYIQKKNRELTAELEKKNSVLLEINDNLEQLVRKRTSDLEMHNKILACSQNILNSLPVAVIGVDPGGVIVQCNRKGQALFGSEDRGVLGMDRNSMFPEEINNIIERLDRNDVCSARVSCKGASINVKAVSMKDFNGQEGIILVFDEEAPNGR
ncbi:MAG: response regulator [Nitrospirota bacterium]|nr:response regulator [Nitrospirota bacterium]